MHCDIQFETFKYAVNESRIGRLGQNHGGCLVDTIPVESPIDKGFLRALQRNSLNEKNGLRREHPCHQFDYGQCNLRIFLNERVDKCESRTTPRRLFLMPTGNGRH